MGRAPSWSWAAVDGPLGFHPPDQPGVGGSDLEISWRLLEPGSNCDSPVRRDIEILSVGVDLAGINPTGQVNGGRLRLVGLMKEVECHSRNFSDPYAPPVEPWRQQELRDVGGEDGIAYGCLDTQQDLELPCKCWCLQLARWRSPSTRFPLPHEFMSGLILVATGKNMDEYQRIGLVWSRTGDGWIGPDGDMFSAGSERREISIV